jgi:hypothetical protein
MIAELCKILHIVPTNLNQQGLYIRAQNGKYALIYSWRVDIGTLIEHTKNAGSYHIGKFQHNGRPLPPYKNGV